MNNKNRRKLVQDIVSARGDGKEYYLHFSCDEIKAVVNSVGHQYETHRRVERGTLVQHLRAAEVS